MNGKPQTTRAGRCPVCGKAATPESHPFCSRRCGDIDLGRWLNGTYAIPAVEPPDDFDPEAGQPVSNDNRPAGKGGA